MMRPARGEAADAGGRGWKAPPGREGPDGLDAERPRSLRCAVLLDAPRLLGWQGATLAALDDAGVTLTEVAVADERPTRGGAGGTSPRARGASRAGRLALGVLLRLARSRALAPGGELPATGSPDRRSTAATPTPGGGSRDVDLVLWLGSGSPPEGVAGLARMGAWWLHHGDAPDGAADPPGVRELLRRRPVVRAALLARAPGDSSPVALREGWFATAPDSLGRTIDRVLLGAAAWPALACREAASRPGPPRSGTGRALPATSPSAGAGAGDGIGLGRATRLVALLTEARFRRLWHHGLRHDDWNIGVLRTPVAELVRSGVARDVDWAPTRQGRYAADPFGTTDGDGILVHFEDFDHASGTAAIAHRRWSDRSGWGRLSSALEIGSHLSYPFVLEHEGRWFLLPESRASGALVLYVADRPTGPWTPAAAIEAGDVGDATLLRHDGRWWLFAVRGSTLNPHTELDLWHADGPAGPWQPHPRNPVVVDARAARPAGPPFALDGRLHRPGQDCSLAYGARVTVSRVTRLDPEAYEEEVVAVVRPDPAGPFPDGLHTITGVGDLTLVDGKRFTWSTPALLRAIRARLTR